MKNNKQGFTLVELAIVLVIIGLLIGGILVAQSMINTTKIQAFTRQIGQFDAAVMNFKDKYNALPGDSLIAIGGAVGDGDGYVEPAAAATWTGETANFWIMLQTSGFKSEESQTYVSTALSTTDGLGSTRSPQGKAGQGTAFFAVGTPVAEVFDAVAASTTDVAANGYIAAGCQTRAAAGTSDQPNCTAAFTGPDSIAIDTKLDNGVGTSGNVAALTTAAVVSVSAGILAEPIAYVGTNTTPTYSLAIRMGNAAGNPL